MARDDDYSSGSDAEEQQALSGGEGDVVVETSSLPLSSSPSTSSPSLKKKKKASSSPAPRPRHRPSSSRVAADESSLPVVGGLLVFRRGCFRFVFEAAVVVVASTRFRSIFFFSSSNQILCLFPLSHHLTTSRPPLAQRPRQPRPCSQRCSWCARSASRRPRPRESGGLRPERERQDRRRRLLRRLRRRRRKRNLRSTAANALSRPPRPGPGESR